MSKNMVAAGAGLLIAASLLPIYAQACVTKSGKDCTSTVAHKVDHKVKLGKVAPAANVGAVAHATAPVAMGQVGATTGLQVSPATQEIFYIGPPGAILSDGHRVPPHMFSASVMQHTSGLLNPDGSLTQHAIDIGWQTVTVKVPGQTIYPSVPTPAAVPSLQAPALAPAQSSINGHMQVFYHQLSPEKSKKLNKPGAHREIVASYSVEQMRSQGLIDRTGRLTPRARQQGFATTITPLPGVQYYRTHNGQQIPLTPRQVQQMIQGGGIGIDGTLIPAAINQGYSMVINRPAEPLPQQLATPSHATPDKTPTPQQVATPNLAPQQVVAPGYATPDRTPTPQQVATPNLAPQQVVAPGYATPDRTPTPQQVAAPNLAPQQVVAPGYATPDRTPTPQQVAAPNLAPQQVVAPGYATPDRTPTPQQVAAPNLAPQQMVAPGYATPDEVPTPNPVTTPNLLPTPVLSGNLSNSTAAQHTNGPVEVYHPLHGATYDYADAIETGDPAFHFVVVGFKEPKNQ